MQRPDPRSASHGGGSSRRLTVPRILVIAGTLLGVLAALAVWASRRALETGEWTRTSAELLERPAVQAAVAGYLVDELYADVDVARELQAALPERAAPLAAPVDVVLDRSRVGISADEVS